MKPYLTKTPSVVKFIFKNLIWDFKTEDKEVFLTFDDGPTPEVTTFVLDELRKYNAKATFFCIGKNVAKHPEIFKSILDDEHPIGNHTHNHYNCKEHKLDLYIENVLLAEETILKYNPKNQVQLFRPPYGRISKKATKTIKQKGYKIIMWDVLSADFDTSISAEKCIENVIKNVKSGSIIVFHDSLKAFPVLQQALPEILKNLQNQGYSFSAI